MRTMLLGCAAAVAAAICAAPAAAQVTGDSGRRIDISNDQRPNFFGQFAPGRTHNQFPILDRRHRGHHHDHDGDDGDDDDHDGRHRGSGDIFFSDYGYYGENWALNNNRAWDHDSYNDWWHERPNRAYPRWMKQNKNCERMYWAGGGWRC